MKAALDKIPEKIQELIVRNQNDLVEAWAKIREEDYLSVSFNVKIGHGWSLSMQDAAYIAGVVDGEGCLRVNKVRSKKNGKYYSRYSPSLTIMQKGNKLLSYIASICPEATLWKPKDRPGKYNHWRIQWIGHRAIRMVKAIAPYLKLKKEQAYLMIEFQTRIDECKKHRKNKSLSLPSFETAWRESKIIDMARFKKEVDSSSSVPERNIVEKKIVDSLTFEWDNRQMDLELKKAVDALRPDGKDGIESVTISSGEMSVTLEADRTLVDGEQI